MRKITVEEITLCEWQERFITWFVVEPSNFPKVGDMLREGTEPYEEVLQVVQLDDWKYLVETEKSYFYFFKYRGV